MFENNLSNGDKELKRFVSGQMAKLSSGQFCSLSSLIGFLVPPPDLTVQKEPEAAQSKMACCGL